MSQFDSDTDLIAILAYWCGRLSEKQEGQVQILEMALWVYSLTGQSYSLLTRRLVVRVHIDSPNLYSLMD